MFQNITQDIDKEEYNDNQYNKRFIIKDLFSIQDIVLYIISFMISMVSFGNVSMAPFGLAIFAAVCSNKIPALIIYLILATGTLIKFGFVELLVYILTTLIFIAMILIFRPKVKDETRNEKQKLGIHIMISTFIIQFLKMFFTTFSFSNLLISLIISITVYVFYKVFANSLIVIKEYGIKKAFTFEETIGALLTIAIAILALNFIKIFNISLSNIMIIIIALFLGWKNGIIVGAISGATIGMISAIISLANPIIILIYAISRDNSRNIKQNRKNCINNMLLLKQYSIFLFCKRKFCDNNNG